MSIIISDGRFNKNKVRPWVRSPGSPLGIQFLKPCLPQKSLNNTNHHGIMEGRDAEVLFNLLLSRFLLNAAPRCMLLWLGSSCPY